MFRLFLGLFFGMAVPLFAQNAERDSTQPGSRPSLLSYFKKGKTLGHMRYYFMGTDNEAGLTDYFANAIGGGLKYETAPFHGLSFGLSGFYIFNIGSSDLAKPDPKTGQISRYETGQFDIQNLNNHHDLDRLEELFFHYSAPKIDLVAGRQIIKTPFINPQDGRMRPTAVNGLFAEGKVGAKTHWKGGYFFEVSPRGTVSWSSVQHSIGLYSQGINIYGQRGNFAGKLVSAGVGLFSLSHSTASGHTLNFWDVWIENILNTTMVQLEGPLFTRSGSRFSYGLIAIQQNSLNFGGNRNPEFTYVDKGWQSLSFSSKIAWKSGEKEASLAYTHITDQGRYIMPREWGRDPFYTFMARERNEGLGGLHAVVGRLSKHLPKAHLKPELALGYYRAPDVRNFRLNKYGMPAYWQVNASAKREFQGFAKGLDGEIILLYKGRLGQTYDVPNYVFNKVNMLHLNVIFNYHF